VFFVCFLTIGTAVAQEKKSSGNSIASGSFVLSVTDGRLSLEANDASVAKIFKELGQKAAIEVDVQTGSEAKISIKLDRIPLEEAIKRLSDNVAVIYANEHKIAKISVLLRGGETSTGLQVVKNPIPETTTGITVAKVTPPPATRPAATTKSEAFQFTFNP